MRSTAPNGDAEPCGLRDRSTVVLWSGLLGRCLCLSPLAGYESRREPPPTLIGSWGCFCGSSRSARYGNARLRRGGHCTPEVIAQVSERDRYASEANRRTRRPRRSRGGGET
jgi:hypothetical protein